MLWRSGLPEAVLNAIWASVGVSANGQLTRQEFYSILVLIALAQKNMTIADLTTLPNLPIPHLSTVKPKSMTIKQFKKDSVLSKPNGHLLKTVHPLFTESNVKLNGDLISFDSLENTESTAGKSLFPSSFYLLGCPTSFEIVFVYLDQDTEEDLYSLSSNKPPTVSKIPKQELIPIWERIIDVALDIFAPIKQTNNKLLDAFYTEEGHKYLLALISIQQIIKRICQSCRNCPNADPSLVSKCEIMVAIWDNLVDVIDTDRLAIEEPLEMDQTDYLCNICGQNLNVNNSYFDGDTELSYHINCANFWINKVDRNLPQATN